MVYLRTSFQVVTTAKIWVTATTPGSRRLNFSRWMFETPTDQQLVFSKSSTSWEQTQQQQDPKNYVSATSMKEKR